MKMVSTVRPKAADRSYPGCQSGQYALGKNSVLVMTGSNGAHAGNGNGANGNHGSNGSNGNGSNGISRRPDSMLPEDGASEAARKIEQSIAYMSQHLDQPLHVATLAARAGISPSHFFALFKRQIGCAPIDYFIHLRMQQACRLLDATTLNVKEVAAALGYDDQFYFSRVFKAINNMPPSRYRIARLNDRESRENPGRPLVLPKEVLIPA
jgi:AraC-like DNA-binding protein